MIWVKRCRCSYCLNVTPLAEGRFEVPCSKCKATVSGAWELSKARWTVKEAVEGLVPIVEQFGIDDYLVPEMGAEGVRAITVVALLRRCQEARSTAIRTPFARAMLDGFADPKADGTPLQDAADES